MTVEVVSFGCRLNGVEAETMRHRAVATGLSDLVVVNSCAVTAAAAREAGQAIRRAARARPGARIVVTGCAAEIDPARFAAMPEVSAVLGNGEKMDPDIWARLRDGRMDRVAAGAIASGALVPPTAVTDETAGRARAFVQVQNGCDHDCTFCTIPLGRGRSRSVPASDVVEAVRSCLEGGAHEIVLTGVDITAYGADLGGGVTLGSLVTTILREVSELPRLRLSSIDSVEADRDLLDALATEARLMPHLHLSLQAGHDLTLKRMKRRHSRADSVGFCRTLRDVRPDIVFGADLIAGFPTESEAMFQGSLDLVEECGLTYLHVFPYSARARTPAARMPAVSGPIVRERAARLRAAGDRALSAYLDAQVGSAQRVLVEGSGLARTEGFAPVRLASPAAKAEIRDVRITGRKERELLAA